MSRTQVTPLAMKSGSEMSLASGNQSPNTRCTCMSHRPGIRYPPLPFTLSALRGYFADLLGPMEKMRLPLRITVWSGSSLPVRTSTTVTLSRTSRSFTKGSWACAILGDEGTIHPKASIEMTSRRTGFMDGDCNFFPGEDHIVSSPEHLQDKMRPS